MPVFSLESLLESLKLEVAEPGARYVGSNLPIDYRRVFGGQILAQTVMAATAASPGKTVKSLAVVFPREGDTSSPVTYQVSKHQDGRTFATTGVLAVQGEKVIAAATVSLHVDEEGLLHQSPRPERGLPEDAPEIDLGMVPWETRIVGGVDLTSREAGPAELQLWMRAAKAPADLTTSQALLVHATDLTLIGTALRPFEGLSQADTMQKFHSAVTAHTMWFHQPFDLQDWVLLDQHSPVVARGRAFGRGDVYAADGALVASYAQESMIRTAGFPA